MAIDVIGILGLVFKPLVDLVDDLTLSPEEALDLKQKLLEVQIGFYGKVLDYEARVLEAQSRVVEAEAKSEHWVTATWRPITMLIFTSLVVARWFGFSAPNIPLEIENQLWLVIQIGLGGYVGGRSVEKIAETVGKVMEKRNVT